ncbi:hypothetical protein BDK51DRAFT_37691 [Blyttiomyces helicus]|uniref:Uncharacterized protein n=1 Tax=Blyttiomyces helicus TaxID=388810 RepID=A0A4P9W3X5_9FUNG|nr:hypothetical protein BDK51DRAFT_37691 [Blyttiomyces helicus]|eukprot:RKO84846.1 hypothetical protein BDK51DRAFT_37691 [Blyttiomyces helicus]
MSSNPGYSKEKGKSPAAPAAFVAAATKKGLHFWGHLLARCLFPAKRLRPLPATARQRKLALIPSWMGRTLSALRCRTVPSVAAKLVPLNLLNRQRESQLGHLGGRPTPQDTRRCSRAIPMPLLLPVPSLPGYDGLPTVTAARPELVFQSFVNRKFEPIELTNCRFRAEAGIVTVSRRLERLKVWAPKTAEQGYLTVPENICGSLPAPGGSSSTISPRLATSRPSSTRLSTLAACAAAHSLSTALGLPLPQPPPPLLPPNPHHPCRDRAALDRTRESLLFLSVVSTFGPILAVI